MTPAIDPAIDYNGAELYENSNHLNGRFDAVTSLGKNREMAEASSPPLDVWKTNDLDIPGTFLVGGSLPCEKILNNQKQWLFRREDARAWALQRYGTAEVTWSKGKPTVRKAGVLWATVAEDADPMFWQLRVCTNTSLDLAAEATDGQG